MNLFLVYWGIIFSRVFRKAMVPGLPHTLSLEPTTRCNLFCPECPVGNQTLARLSGDMYMSLFHRIITEITPYLSHLILYFQGEPFLSPHFFDMIQHSKSVGLYVSTSTNGHFLSEKNIEKLLDSGLDRLVISLDGSSSESYTRYRIMGDFNRVVKGIKDLMNERRNRKQAHPYIVIQCLLFAHNIDERAEVKRLSKELGVDAVQFKTAQFYNLDAGNEMIPGHPEFSRYVQDGTGKYILQGTLRNKCTRLWTTAVVTWDGLLVPCCFDKQATYPMGSLRKSDLRDNWRSARFMDFRNKVLKERSTIDICRNCTEGIRK